MSVKTKVAPARERRPRGRPREKDPAVTYAGKSYIVTTFRLSKLSTAQADVIMEALGLSTRTAAVQYALGQVFRTLDRASGQSARALKTSLSGKLKKLGPSK